jgi:hypothetical protein
MSINSTPSHSHPGPAVVCQPGRGAIPGGRAIDELRDLAAQLHGREVNTFDILLACGRRATLLARLGATLPADAALSAVRALLGLERWDPLANWSARLEATAGIDPESLAQGIPDEDLERAHRRRRAVALSDWLREHGGSPIAEELVIAAEAVCCRHLEEGETWED